MAILSAAEILAVDDSVSETVPVPEWGGDVIVKGMTGTERDALEASMRRKGDGGLDLRNARAKLLVRVLVNENGTRIFSDLQIADLGKRSAAVIDRLYDVAARLSGMGDAEEEMEGNSETEDGDGSSSSSPATSEA